MCGPSACNPVPSAFIVYSCALPGLQRRLNAIFVPSGDHTPHTASLSVKRVSCRCPVPSGFAVTSWSWSSTRSW
jgi:hypothetical protein